MSKYIGLIMFVLAAAVLAEAGQSIAAAVVLVLGGIVFMAVSDQGNGKSGEV